MKRSAVGMLVVAALALGVGACRECPTRPTWSRPVISSIVAFPTTLRLGDSTLVTVTASDPDGDTLVYDWFACNGLRIKDDPLDYGMLYNTPDNSHVFYLHWKVAGCDTAYVTCEVRDGRGGSDSRRIRILLSD